MGPFVLGTLNPILEYRVKKNGEIVSMKMSSHSREILLRHPLVSSLALRLGAE